MSFTLKQEQPTFPNIAGVTKLNTEVKNPEKFDGDRTKYLEWLRKLAKLGIRPMTQILLSKPRYSPNLILGECPDSYPAAYRDSREENRREIQLRLLPIRIGSKKTLGACQMLLLM